MVDFGTINTSPKDMKLISKISGRASSSLGADKLSTDMDLTVVHDINPLRLSELLKADNFNFAHDIVGIANHLDRETGELKLLSSHPISFGIEAVRESISKYLYGSTITLTVTSDPKIWDVANKNRDLPHYRVIQKKNRYRFELN